jgi:hypothetical protein
LWGQAPQVHHAKIKYLVRAFSLASDFGMLTSALEENNAMTQQTTHETQANPKTQDIGAQAEGGASNRQKDPADWVTAEEPMTGAQASYLKTLCEEANEPFDADLNKAKASIRIDELRHNTGKAASA